jgi:hypothetical protein
MCNDDDLGNAQTAARDAAAVFNRKQAVLDRARARHDKAKAALAKVEAQARRDARKVDTRRAIVIGKLLLKAAGDDAHFANVAREIAARAAPRDRDLFPDLLSGGSGK